MIRWKDSVKFDGLHAAMVLAVMRAEPLYAAEGADLWVTSANDATHMAGSKHYVGRALDFRVHNLPSDASRLKVTAALRSALGPTFTVLLEGAGTGNAHLHVQFNGQ